MRIRAIMKPSQSRNQNTALPSFWLCNGHRKHFSTKWLTKFCRQEALIHIIYTKTVFVFTFLKSCDHSTVSLADSTTVISHTCGGVIITMNGCIIYLRKVLFVPSFGYNLLSTWCLANNSIKSHFCRSDILLKLESNRKVVGREPRNVLNSAYWTPVSILSHDTYLCYCWLAQTNFKDVMNVH